MEVQEFIYQYNAAYWRHAVNIAATIVLCGIVLGGLLLSAMRDCLGDRVCDAFRSYWWWCSLALLAASLYWSTVRVSPAEFIHLRGDAALVKQLEDWRAVKRLVGVPGEADLSYADIDRVLGWHAAGKPNPVVENTAGK